MFCELWCCGTLVRGTDAVMHGCGHVYFELLSACEDVSGTDVVMHGCGHVYFELLSACEDVKC
jgi:hypothetical protein